MGNFFSPVHLIVILLIILVLFGRGKISEFMGDFAKGIKSFKKGLKEDDEDEEQQSVSRPEIKTIDVKPETNVEPLKSVATAQKASAVKAAPRTTKAKAKKTTTRKTTKS
ncbi:twin-arginine translocase TatA/TatE family subunit [uncultured Bartonella sp.]|uniref:twin-arginine translocase TatA/TatE family subunit n=1 Tax=uncultured Bartonella sp. TaxID=104108 RepID=UPI002635D4F3|nr:twin-arginine translocase TatA/TatE family subunit [uncultured Bartonella sp.]